MLVGTFPCGATTGAGGGSGGAAIDLRNGAAYRSEVTPTDSTATWTILLDGTCTSTGEATYTWLLSGANSDYEIFVSVTSGALTSGATGLWLVLSSSRAYSVTRTSNVVGSDSATLACQIRRVSDGVVLATSTVTVTAEVVA